LKRLEDVPGPTLWAADGAYWAYRWLSDPADAHITMRARFGPRFRLPSNKPGWNLVLADAESVRELLALDPRCFAEPAIGREALSAVLGSESVFLLAGDRHRRARQLLGPAIIGERLGGLLEMMWRTVQRWTLAGSTTGVVDLLPAMRDITLEVMLHALLDPISDEELARSRSVLRAPLDDAPARLLFLPALQRSWLPAWRRFEALRSARDAFLLERVRTAEPATDGGLLSRLVQRNPREPAEQLRDHLVTMLVAGHDTTAMVAACALDALARDPKIASELREELGDEGTPKRLAAKTPLLDAVCKEALRVFPVATEAVRTVGSEKVAVGEVELEPGTNVFIAIPAVHKDADLYPSPQQFDPARFLRRPYESHEFLPFGAGHRLCLGWALATLELRCVIATVVTACDLAPVTSRRPKLRRYNLGMGPDTQVPVRLTRR